MNSEVTILRGRTRNRWQNQVEEDGRIVGGEKWQDSPWVMQLNLTLHILNYILGLSLN
jgi:hypothetical protein